MTPESTNIRQSDVERTMSVTSNVTKSRFSLVNASYSLPMAREFLNLSRNRTVIQRMRVLKLLMIFAVPIIIVFAEVLVQ
jgi:hypothetical protein